MSRTWSTTQAHREYLREYARPRLANYFVGLAVTVTAVAVFTVARVFVG